MTNTINTINTLSEIPFVILNSAVVSLLKEFNQKAKTGTTIKCKSAGIDKFWTAQKPNYFCYNLHLYSGGQKLGIYPIEFNFFGGDPVDPKNWQCVDLTYTDQNWVQNFLQTVSLAK